MRAVVRIATVLMLVLSLGLHWALLQTVAWTGMIISYSQDASLLTAVEKTFDGKHPCCLCKTIKQGRSEERKQSQQQPASSLKLEFPLATQSLILMAPELAEVRTIVNGPCSSFRLEPPTPPPRPATA